MKMARKAVVIGGSNGIGLAISKQLIQLGYHINILDIYQPDDSIEHTTYYPYNMLDLDLDLLEDLSKDPQVDTLMITAGIGRVADFEFLHTSEIEKTMIIDVVSAIKVIRVFYDRIKNEIPFYCGIMGCIATCVTECIVLAIRVGVIMFTKKTRGV